MTRKSYLGKLYDTVQQQVDENAWISELVDHIMIDLGYMIEVEQHKLPMSCLMPSSTFTNLTEEDIDAVIRALEIKGIIATAIVDGGFGYFKVTELL